MYTLRESFTIDRRMDAEDFIVSLESSIESYPLQSRNEFVEEQLVYKGGERKKRNKKGWREREEEKIKKIIKKKKTSIRCRLCGIHIRLVFDEPVRATRLRQ